MNPAEFNPKVAMALQAVVLLSAFVGAVVLVVTRKDRLLAVVAGVFVAACAAALAARRDTFLPFLGHAALPPTLLKEAFAPRNANVEAVVAVDAPDGARVLYWGAKPAEEVRGSPNAAYDDYSNAGVAVAAGKRATLRFECPASYRVPGMGALERHVHYRVVAGGGLIGPVRTAYVTC
jgi:hypothetical protein